MRRIRVDLMFENAVEADEVWAKTKSFLKDKQIVNTEREVSFIHYEECHHGEKHPQRCVIIEYFEKE